MLIVHYGEAEKTDLNGQIIEQLLEENDLVCLNDGRKTRIDVHTGKGSALDLNPGVKRGGSYLRVGDMGGFDYR